MNVLVTTSLPSPYQVELFDALAASGKVDITVLYWRRKHRGRSWALPNIAHDHRFLEELSVEATNDLVQGRDLVVYSGYHPRLVRQLIAMRTRSGQPWAFWGERPGFLLPSWLSHWYRQTVLPELGTSGVPIWGIGSWAVDEYRRLYGNNRMTLNIPYFSSLDDFLAVPRKAPFKPARRILFSGSLIKRKGVDLLMKAFLAIAPEFPELELDIIGNGPMLNELRAMSASVAGRVRFEGFKQWAELPAYYAQADILCAPSRYDGWGMIIPEGLAAGLLVVSTNKTGAARELLDANVGWMVQAGALHPLIEALRAAASTIGPDRATRIAKGRFIATGQGIAAGVERVLAAIQKSHIHATTMELGGPARGAHL